MEMTTSSSSMSSLPMPDSTRTSTGSPSPSLSILMMLAGLAATVTSLNPSMPTWQHLENCTGPSPISCHASWCVTAPSQAPAITGAEQAQRVATVLGLSKSDLAKAFGISRPSLYAWLNGDSEPQGENATRLGLLSQIIDETMAEANHSLYPGYVNRALPGRERSLLDLLLQPEWDLVQIRDCLQEASRLTRERNARLSRLAPRTMPSPEQQRRNLLDNLATMGG